MIFLRKSFFTFILIVCIENIIVGQVGGSSTYEFLNLTNSARAAALGGRPIALNDDDLNLVFINPGLLSEQMHKNLALNYNSYYAGIGFGYAAYAFQGPKTGTIAVGCQYVNYGSFLEADQLGNLYSQFYARDLVLNGMYSKNLDSSFRIGVTLKAIYSKYERYISYGLATDIGILYHSQEHLFSAALVIRNLGTQVKTYTSNTYEKLPFEIELGVSKKLKYAPFRFNFTAHNLQRYDMLYDSELSLVNFNEEKTKSEKFFDNFFRHMIGSIEFLPSKTMYLAAGFNYQRRMEMGLVDAHGLTGFSFGAGIRTQKFSFSYGQSIYHAAGGTQQFSVVLNLGRIMNKE